VRTRRSKVVGLIYPNELECWPQITDGLGPVCPLLSKLELSQHLFVLAAFESVA
jgi:hypothetical protein